MKSNPVSQGGFSSAKNISRFIFRPVLAVFCLSAASLPAQTLIDQYALNGNLNDSMGGLPLVNHGATVGAGSLSFGPSQGPTVAVNNASVAGGNYSLLLNFSVSQLNGGWIKLVDFLSQPDFATQSSGNIYTGSYIYGNQLQFLEAVNLNPGPSPKTYVDGSATHAAGQSIELLLTRDGGSGAFNAYLNGATVPDYSFTDSTGQAIPNTVGGNPEFALFQCNYGFDESVAGTLSAVAVWDGPLTTAADIQNAFALVPEPSVLTLLGTSLLACWCFAVRRPARQNGR